MIKLLEMPVASRPPLPLSVIWTYPALDFNFTSFMPPEHLQILRQESTAAIRGVAQQKDHLKHQSPLAVVDEPAPQTRRRRRSWSKSFSKLPFVGSGKSPLQTPSSPGKRFSLPFAMTPTTPASGLVDTGHEADIDDEEDQLLPVADREKSLSDRVQYWNPVSNGEPSTLFPVLTEFGRIEATPKSNLSICRPARVQHTTSECRHWALVSQ